MLRMLGFIALGALALAGVIVLVGYGLFRVFVYLASVSRIDLD